MCICVFTYKIVIINGLWFIKGDTMKMCTYLTAIFSATMLLSSGYLAASQPTGKMMPGKGGQKPDGKMMPNGQKPDGKMMPNGQKPDGKMMMPDGQKPDGKMMPNTGGAGQVRIIGNKTVPH
jgi:hypothetical protein